MNFSWIYRLKSFVSIRHLHFLVLLLYSAFNCHTHTLHFISKLTVGDRRCGNSYKKYCYPVHFKSFGGKQTHSIQYTTYLVIGNALLNILTLNFSDEDKSDSFAVCGSNNLCQRWQRRARHCDWHRFGYNIFLVSMIIKIIMSPYCLFNLNS